jgi:hypothetical protein
MIARQTLLSSVLGYEYAIAANFARALDVIVRQKPKRYAICITRAPFAVLQLMVQRARRI